MSDLNESAQPDGPETPDPAATSEASAEPVAEPAAESAPDTAVEAPAAAPVEAKPAKNLGRGIPRQTDESLLSQGVATTRLGSDAAKKEAMTSDDPADEPMYRPGMDWFVLRVASNKENYVRDTLLRKVQIEGMEHLVGRIMVPTEKIKTLKGNKPKITEQKLYPGYVFVEMTLEPDGRIPQDVFFLIKETTGVGDFVGTAGRPTPLGPTDVEKMLFDSRKPEEAPTVKMEFEAGDHVTIKEGPFENFQGTVDEVIPDRGIVRVLATIFGRQAPIELEYWQIAKAEE